MADIDSLITSLEQAASQDDASRAKVLGAMQQLQYRLETPFELYNRYSFAGFEIAITQLACNLHLHEILAESDKPLTVEELATKTSAAPLFLRRILRYLASVGQIGEPAPNTFKANTTTKTLALPGFRGTIYHAFENVGTVMQSFPQYMADIEYRDTVSSSHTAAQKRFNIDVPIFAWMPTQPERFENFQLTMTMHSATTTAWFTVFPFEKEIQSFQAEKEVFVDVGGGFGHQSMALLAAFPQLKGRIVVQDMAATFAHAPPMPEGIQAQTHDFFQEEPIKGAKFYYMRQILHDWADENAIAILRRMKEALGPDSSILIDDMVMPDQGAHWYATSTDLVMMSCLGSLERTESDWRVLIEKAGLRIQQIFTHVPGRQDSIIQVVAL